MKKNQNFKDHINYFKKTDTLKYVGGVMAVLGVLLYMFGWSYVSYIIATVFLPAGGVLFLIGSSGARKRQRYEGVYCQAHRRDGA